MKRKKRPSHAVRSCHIDGLTQTRGICEGIQPPKITETVNENGDIVFKGTFSVSPEIVEKCGGEEALKAYLIQECNRRFFEQLNNILLYGIGADKTERKQKWRNYETTRRPV